MIVSLLVVAFRFANALLITTTFAPDEYYQAMEPAYLYATGFLPAPWPTTTSSPLWSLRQLSWEWAPDEALRPATPVLIIAQLHRILLWAERRGFLTAWVAGWAHARVARLVGALLAAAVDIATPHLAAELLEGKCGRFAILASSGAPKPSVHSNARSMAYLVTVRKHALAWSLLSHWLFFAQPRPLVNCWETAFTVMGIAGILNESYPVSAAGAACGGLALILRMSSAPLWLVVILWKAQKQTSGRAFAWWLTTVAAPPVLLVVMTTIVADSYWYGSYDVTKTCDVQWTSTEFLLNFFQQHVWWSPLQWVWFNTVHAMDAAIRFGSHPSHWYWSAGVWAVAAPQLILVAAGILLKRPRMKSSVMFHTPACSWCCAAIFGYIMLHSIVPHKEERFLTPLVPILNALAAVTTTGFFTENREVARKPFLSDSTEWTTSRSKWRQMIGTSCMYAVVALSICAGYYLSRWHQAGPEIAFHKLRQHVAAIHSDHIIQRRNRPQSRELSLHILAPCFSTPGLSFLHLGISSIESIGAEVRRPILHPWMLKCEGHTRIRGTEHADTAGISASEIFESSPYLQLMDLYANDSFVPDFVFTWENDDTDFSSLSVDAQTEDYALLQKWVRLHFTEISRDFHGHFPTMGSSYSVVWQNQDVQLQ